VTEAIAPRPAILGGYGQAIVRLALLDHDPVGVGDGRDEVVTGSQPTGNATDAVAV
jgi:hypothetical protein